MHGLPEDERIPAPGLRDPDRDTKGHTVTHAERDAYLYSDPDALADAYEHADLDTDHYPDPDEYRD